MLCNYINAYQTEDFMSQWEEETDSVAFNYTEEGERIQPDERKKLVRKNESK